MNRLRVTRGLAIASALALMLAADTAWPTAGPAPVQAREPEPASVQDLVDALPAFLADDDAAETQLRQLQIFYRQNSIADVWAMHMAPVLAPGVDAVQAEEPYSPEELDAFREQLDAFVGDLADLLEYLPEERVLDTDQTVEQSRAVVAVASEEQLSEAKRLYDQYPGYLETPGWVLDVLRGDTPVESPGGILPTFALDRVARPDVVIPVPDETVPQYPNCKLYGGTGIGDNGTCDGCPPPPEGNLATVFALETAAFVNGAICEYIPDAVFVIATSIQNPFKLLCTSLRTGFEIAAASVAYQSKLNSECEGGYHWGILHAYLDAEVSTRASQASFDHYSARSLRLDIEENLLDVLDDRVSLFQLPASQDGYLDAVDDVSVRYVVSDTIHMQELAGYDDEIRNALDEYNAAEALRAAGDYKSAYARYRKAYRAAVRVGREP